MITELKSAFDTIFTQTEKLSEMYAQKSADLAREMASIQERVRANIEEQREYAKLMGQLSMSLDSISESAYISAENTANAFEGAMEAVPANPATFIAYCANCGKPICAEDTMFEVNTEYFCAECEEASIEYEAELAEDEDESEDIPSTDDEDWA